MSDAPSKKFDPTESVRTLTSAPFKESYMTLREHQDTDKHYIGDSLPIASDSMMAPAGVGSTAGTLAFPARADHRHEERLVFGWFNSNYQTVAPGAVFINNLQFTGWGRNMLATSQVVAFPFPGIYFLHLNLSISRDAGGTFTNEVNFRFYYQNGSSSKYILRQSNFDLPNPMYVNMTDLTVIGNSAPSANDNVQIAVEQNDGSNWSVAVQDFFVFRISGITSN